MHCTDWGYNTCGDRNALGSKHRTFGNNINSLEHQYVCPVYELGTDSKLNLILRFVIGRHHRGFWPTEGWSFTHLTKVSKQKRFSPRFSETSPKDRVFEFYKLYLPSALAIASDFWRVTVIGVIAASRGSVEVGRQ